MICAELERLEARFDDLLTALEDPDLTAEERQALQQQHDEMMRTIRLHQASGHEGKECFEE